MRLSIIVPVYNVEKYLEECIESILSQKHPVYEIILVDDGSEDSSPQIVDSYKNDSRVHVIHQNNAGVSTSRNNALKVAKGEYICIVDQDDVLSENYVTYLYSLCINNDAEIALTPDVDKLFETKKEDDVDDIVKVISGREAVITMLYHKFVIAPWNKIIKKSLIDASRISFNPEYFNGEGFAFSIECFQSAVRVAVGNKKVYHYRVGDPDTGASIYKEQYLNSSINAQQYIKSKLVFNDPEVLASWEFSNWHTHCDAFNVMVGCGAKNKNIVLYKKLKKNLVL